MVYFTQGTIQPPNKPTGLPDCQPGSVEWSAQYRAATDPLLEEDVRKAAREAEIAAAKAEMQAAAAHCREHRHPPDGFIIVAHRTDPMAGISAGLLVVPGVFVVRQEMHETVRGFGFEPITMSV